MKLLLVEDEVSLSRAITTILQKNGYTVEAVYNGRDALEYMEAEEYDGVILDLMLPETDGITVLQTVRKKGNKTPILILTAKAEVDDKVLGLDSGANDYLTKPFAIQELMARIRAMTRNPWTQTDTRLRFGNLTLDCATFELSSPSGSFRLANKEFQMMELFLRNPRKLISTNRFIERIWGYDSEVEASVVWVYISYLRKKLASLESNVQIKAARNAGYSLEECP